MAVDDRSERTPGRGAYPGRTLLLLVLVALVAQTLLLAGFFAGWFDRDDDCGRPILLSGSGSAYSDFHADANSAIQLARSRVQAKADQEAAVAIGAYQCSSRCPNKQGTTATADITNVRESYGPPGGPGTESAWWARADYNWYANVVCSR